MPAETPSMWDRLNGVVGEDPVPFEKWVEITEAQTAAAVRGVDPLTVLTSYGLSATAWATIGGWWSEKLNAQSASLMGLYRELSAHYRAVFSELHSAPRDVSPSRSPAS